MNGILFPLILTGILSSTGLTQPRIITGKVIDEFDLKPVSWVFIHAQDSVNLEGRT